MVSERLPYVLQQRCNVIPDDGLLSEEGNTYTIGHGTTPLAINGHLVARGHPLAEAAGAADVSADVHVQLTDVEDLVVVGVKQEVLLIVTPVVPGVGALEGVMEGDRHAGARAAYGFVTLSHEGLDGAHVDLGAHGLVEEFNGRHGGVVGVVVTDLLERLDSLGYGVALEPADAASLTGVVEAVLRSRGAMEINHDLSSIWDQYTM